MEAYDKENEALSDRRKGSSVDKCPDTPMAQLLRDIVKWVSIGWWHSSDVVHCERLIGG